MTVFSEIPWSRNPDLQAEVNPEHPLSLGLVSATYPLLVHGYAFDAVNQWRTSGGISTANRQLTAFAAKVNNAKPAFFPTAGAPYSILMQRQVLTAGTGNRSFFNARAVYSSDGIYHYINGSTGNYTLEHWSGTVKSYNTAIGDISGTIFISFDGTTINFTIWNNAGVRYNASYGSLGSYGVGGTSASVLSADGGQVITSPYFFLWNRAISESAALSLTKNPWQIFAPIQRKIWIPVSAPAAATPSPTYFTQKVERTKQPQSPVGIDRNTGFGKKCFSALLPISRTPVDVACNKISIGADDYIFNVANNEIFFRSRWATNIWRYRTGDVSGLKRCLLIRGRVTAASAGYLVGCNTTPWDGLRLLYTDGSGLKAVSATNTTVNTGFIPVGVGELFTALIWRNSSEIGIYCNQQSQTASTTGNTDYSAATVAIGASVEFSVIAQFLGDDINTPSITGLLNNPWQIFEPEERVVFAPSSEVVGGAVTIAVPNASVAITGQAPTVNRSYVLAPASRALSVTGQAPTIVKNSTVSPNATAVTTTGYAPTVNQSYVISPNATAVTTTGYAPTVNQSYVISPNATALTTTGYAPTVNQSYVYAPANASLTTTGEIPTVDIFTGVATVTQEGFRWRNDDGTEVTATWRQNQDVDDYRQKNQTIRLRFVIDASGDPTTKQFQLEYRKVGATDWAKVT